MNIVTLTGRLGRDPKFVTEGDNSRAHFSIAVDNRRSDEPDWIPVVAFARQAQLVAEHVAKGHLVAVEGRLASRKTVDDDGETRSYINVIAHHVEFLARPKGTGTDSDPATEPDPLEEPF
jgi:single-strand DNA-binding protein